MPPSHPFSPSPCKSGSEAQTRHRLLQHHLSCSSLDGATSPLHQPFSAGRDDETSSRTHQQICWTLFPCPHLSPTPLPAERTRAQLLRWRWSRADPKCQGGRSRDFCPHSLTVGRLGTACPQSSIHQLLWVPAPLRSAGEEDWAFPGVPEAPHLPSVPEPAWFPPLAPLPGSFSISHASSIGCRDEEVLLLSAWCWARR